LGRWRNPQRLDLAVVATVTGPHRHPGASMTRGEPVADADPGGTLAPAMAKKKRRKLRARRSKANHGRRPNAGRG
jgi:hypothetical protein